MSIYVIADLHLSFAQPKPMNIFGENWTNHEEKIKTNWKNTVKPDDTVILPGDFSWATYLEDTYKDFEYLNELPRQKNIAKRKPRLLVDNSYKYEKIFTRKTLSEHRLFIQ